MLSWCRLGLHRAVPGELWNDGYYFSRCAGCGIDPVRRGPEWRPVPKGYRVVWKPREHWQIDWTARRPYHNFPKAPQAQPAQQAQQQPSKSS